MSNLIRSVVKIEDTQRTIKKFFAEKYDETVKEYIDNVKLVMKKNKFEALPALLEIAKMPHYQESGMVQALYISATYEIIVNKK